MLPAEIYILKTTAAIFLCAFSLSQSNLADMFGMWLFAKSSQCCFLYWVYSISD